MDQPIRMMLRWLILPLILLVFLYLISVGSSFFLAGLSGQPSTGTAIADGMRQQLGDAAYEVWSFVRPLLQLGMVLLIVYSFVRALGIDVGLKTLPQNISIQALLAFLVVSAFALASFLSRDPASGLKDLALVVVGFYFGTKARDQENDGPRRPEALPPVPPPSREPPASESDLNPPSSEEPPKRHGPEVGAGESVRSKARDIEEARRKHHGEKAEESLRPDYEHTNHFY
jgi:hypothetical protein